jgi:DNA-binding winged helix-turn-helix (wHTH) protein
MKEFPPFPLDDEGQCLWRGEERVTLTPKAFSILCYMVKRAGRLVTQSELLEALWPDTFVQPDVLKSHILDVRSALGDDARNPSFIETQQRRGYRFIAAVQDSVGREPNVLSFIGLPSWAGMMGLGKQYLNCTFKYAADRPTVVDARWMFSGIPVNCYVLSSLRVPAI